MFVRVLLAALAALALVGGASAQTTPTCTTGLQLETCTSSNFATDLTGQRATLSFGFYYCAPLVGYGQGQILGLQVPGTLAITSNPGGFTGALSVTALSGSITTLQPGSVTAASVGTGQAAIQAFNTGGSNALITIGTTTVSLNQIGGAPIYSGGVALSAAIPNLPSTLQSFPTVNQDSCTATRGDPLFSGFRGQQFYVAGEDGQVMNFISTFNMQLNARFITLEEGASLYPYQQEKIRVESELAHLSEPSVATFPRTTPWSHPGNYIAEVGVALLNDNRVYIKAGSFATGFAKVSLNGRAMPVSDEFVTFGQGANTTYVQRVSAHELMVRTVSVEFTVTNSDNFLNVDQVHLERGARQYNKFGGLLGKTTDAAWSYSVEEEKAAVITSNNLFERSDL